MTSLTWDVSPSVSDFNPVNVGKMIIIAKGSRLLISYLKAAVDSPMPMDLAPRSMPLTEPPPLVLRAGYLLSSEN